MAAGFRPSIGGVLGWLAWRCAAVFRCVPGINVTLPPCPTQQRWQFPPTQNTTRETDGSLTVRFRAGGTQEMCKHLFTPVTVIEPENLRLYLPELAEMLARHHGV